MKRIYKKIIFIIPFVFILYSFTGCAEYFYPEKEPYAGEVITPDQIAEISESIAESKAIAESEKAANIEAVTEPPFVPETDVQGNVVVYWTENGSVWHINLRCASLSRSVKIESGSEDLALNSGKERLCKKCSELIFQEESTSKE